MNLVQVVRELPPAPMASDPEGVEGAPTSGGRRYEVVKDFKSVSDALAAIRSDKLGDGPFGIITVHKMGLRLKTVEKRVLEPGTTFGTRGPKASSPKAAPPASKKAPAK